MLGSNCFTDPEIEALKADLLKKADKEGKIEKEALATVISSSSQGFLSPAMANLLTITGPDVKVLRVDQFIASVKRAKYGEEIDETFRAFDLDGDGLITLQELRSVLKKLGEEFSDDEVRDLIEEADLDGDGKVSFQEFEKMIIERDCHQ